MKYLYTLVLILVYPLIHAQCTEGNLAPPSGSYYSHDYTGSGGVSYGIGQPSIGIEETARALPLFAYATEEGLTVELLIGAGALYGSKKVYDKRRLKKAPPRLSGGRGFTTYS